MIKKICKSCVPQGVVWTFLASEAKCKKNCASKAHQRLKLSFRIVIFYFSVIATYYFCANWAV